MVRVEMLIALTNGTVSWCFSTSNESMPKCDSRIEALSPTGPPPTMRTGTSRASGIMDTLQRRIRGSVVRPFIRTPGRYISCSAGFCQPELGEAAEQAAQRDAAFQLGQWRPAALVDAVAEDQMRVV